MPLSRVRERDGARRRRWWEGEGLLTSSLALVAWKKKEDPHPDLQRVNSAPRCSGHAGGMTDPAHPRERAKDMSHFAYPGLTSAAWRAESVARGAKWTSNSPKNAC